MTEASVVAKMLTYLRANVPGAVVFKHADLVTGGIPDISVTCHGRTTWLEVKLLTERETGSSLRKHFNQLQLATMILLENQGHTYYLTALLTKADGLKLAILSPAFIGAALELPGTTGMRAARFKPFKEGMKLLAELLPGVG